MDISDHLIWKQVSAFKKPLHLLRIYLAGQYAKLFSRDIFVGVTGSVGKTTCVQASKLVLEQKGKTLSTISNLDPVFNIPITILKVNPYIRKVILEMGVEYKGEMDFYLSMVRPKTVIITKLSFAHSEFLGSIEDILAEKGKLVESLPADGLAILNGDDIYSKKLASKSKAQVIYFGKDPKTATIWAGNIKIRNFKTIFELNYGVERVPVELQLLGEHQIYPVLAAAALGVANDIPLIKIKHALEKITPEQHRLQSLPGPNGSVILDDTYNSSPAAVEGAIDTLLSVPARRRIVVLGEMRELGEFSDRLHRQIARKIYSEKIDSVFLGGGEAQIIADELQKLGFLEERLEYNLQNPQIVSKLLKVLGKGDVCLIKGSRAVRLDEVIIRIVKK